jgi:DNA-binding CsgD family transcriptional regulator
MSARLERLGIADVDLSPAPELAEALAQCGRAAEAAEVSADYRRRASAKGQPWALARAARAEGLVAGDEAFSSWFEQALRWHDSTPDTFERARSELAYGERLRRARRRGDARPHLREAFAAFHQLGAETWAERARLELAATGETARKRDPSTLDQLTPRELQVALDLASGLTTREAAAKLYLSPKTVEYHLRSVYRKLGIASRAQLAEAFARAEIE